NVTPQPQSDTGANFLPDVRGRDGSLGKNRPTGIGFRLKAEHAPDVAALRILKVPTDHFGDIINVAPGNGKTQRVLEEQPGLFAQTEREVGECLAHGMQVRFAFDPPDRVAVPARLRHADVDANLA